MNEIKKIVITCCFSLLIPIVFLMGTCDDVWANNQVSYQMKSNVGITFIEEDKDDKDQSTTEDSFDKNNAQTNDKKGTLPSTGAQQTIAFSVIGMGLCIAIGLYKKKKYK